MGKVSKYQQIKQIIHGDPKKMMYFCHFGETRTNKQTWPRAREWKKLNHQEWELRQQPTLIKTALVLSVHYKSSCRSLKQSTSHWPYLYTPRSVGPRPTLPPASSSFSHPCTFVMTYSSPSNGVLKSLST